MHFIRVNHINRMRAIESVVLLLLIGLASAQVIGIDLGTEFWKASLISPGKNLVIVENSRSSRKSHNGLAFLEGIRHFEYDAFSKRLKKPKTTYFYLNKLIESLDHPQPVPGHAFENGTYHFTEGEETMTLQQLVGMILKNVKKYASQQADSDIKDAVFTVPAHWGFKARMALVNAAAIGELNALGLINENTAAAIHFAITRNDSEPINIGFFNLGSHNLQISIVQFFGTPNDKGKTVESLRVLSHISVPNVGGLAVDQSIAEYVAAQFQAKHKLDIRKSQKSWVKLMHKCADAKEVLSANKEVNIYIEGVIDGIDLNMIVKREVLEQAAVFPVIAQKLEESLQKAGISKSELHSVEVIGGASRIPLVNKIVKDFFEPVQVGSHINGDESMAFGSALRAANLSIAFRVKQLYVYDGHPENVRAVVSNAEDGVLSESIIFDKDSEQGLKREIVVEESEEDIKVAIFYGEELIHEYLLANISNWKNKYNASEVNITETPKTHLIFWANSITVAELKEAYVNISLNVSSTRDVYQLVVENVTEGQTGEKEEENPVQGEEKKQTEDPEEATQETDSSNKTDTDQATKSQSKKKKNRERTKSVKKTIEQYKVQSKKYTLKFTSEFQKYKRYTKDEVQALRLVIAKFQKHENYLQEKARVRNDFESTLYSLKDDFENPGLKTFSTPAELEKLKKSVTEELEWLQENAWTAEKVDFQRHFRSIQRVYNPIVNRSQEYKERQAKYNQTIEILSLVYSKTAELNATQPWVSQKALGHLKKINETFEWIQEKVKEQVSRKLNEDIVFYNQQMINKAEDLRDQYYLIKMTPRPKVVRKVPETPKTESQAQPTKQEQSSSPNEQQPQQANSQQQSGNSQEAGSGRSAQQPKQDL